MDPAAKAKKIQQILDLLFPDPAVPLHYRDTYTLLIAVLLSGRCTDARVNQVTPQLFAFADTPKKMVLLSIEEIQALIRSCGLSPQKARAIFAFSHILLEQHQGQVPSTYEALEALPGVGHKTAAVVLSQGFGIPAFPVDTHIFRCARRWGLSRGKTASVVEKDMKKLYPPSSWNRLHLQIIYFGREFCPARGHCVQTCPICKWTTTMEERACKD